MTEERYVVELVATLTPDEASEVAERAAPQLGQQVERVQRLLVGAPGPITKPLEPRLARGVAEVLRRAGAQVVVGHPGDARATLMSSPSWPAPVTEREPPSLTPKIGPEERRSGPPAPAEGGERAAEAPPAPATDPATAPARGAERDPASTRRPQGARGTSSVPSAAPAAETPPASSTPGAAGSAAGGDVGPPAEGGGTAGSTEAAGEPSDAAVARAPEAPPAARPEPELPVAPAATPEGPPHGGHEVPPPPSVGTTPDPSPGGAAAREEGFDDLDRFDASADGAGGDEWSDTDWETGAEMGASASAAPTVGRASRATPTDTAPSEPGSERAGTGVPAGVGPAEVEPRYEGDSRDGFGGDDPEDASGSAGAPPRDFDWGPSRWTQARRAFLLLLLIVAVVVLVLLQMNRASPAGGHALDYTAGLEAYRRGDFALAARAWEGVATGGNPRAMYMLGHMAELGQGQPWSNRRAAGWYRQAAERGLPEAQLALGSLYQRGLGVPQSDGQAARWYGLAAQQGLAEAQLRYARALFEGRGVPRDFGAAIVWFERAAEAGVPEARAMLAFHDWRGGP